MLVDTVRYEVDVCACACAAGSKGKKNITPYILDESIKSGLGLITEQTRGGSQYPTALDLKPYLQKH